MRSEGKISVSADEAEEPAVDKTLRGGTDSVIDNGLEFGLGYGCVRIRAGREEG